MEITVLCHGDAFNLNTWSNMPYFLTKGLEECGYVVNRIDVSTTTGMERYVQALYNRTVVRLIRLIYPQTKYDYSRSFFRRHILNKRIKKIVEKYNETDVYINMSYDFPVCFFTKKPVINICDWTLEFEILHNQNKTIDRFEMHQVILEEKILRNSTMNVIWRRDCREILCKRFNNIYIGTKTINAVNINYSLPAKNEIIGKKISSNEILFLGAKRYVMGASVFAQAISELVEEGYNIHGSIIGVKEDELNCNPEMTSQIRFFGYLDKNDSEQNNAYYEEILYSKIVVNTNPGFISLAGISEACYLYTPIVISKHAQTEAVFGDINVAGLYCENEKEALKKSILYMINISQNEYVQRCINAHEMFSDASWQLYMEEIVNTMFKNYY